MEKNCRKTYTFLDTVPQNAGSLRGWRATLSGTKYFSCAKNSYIFADAAKEAA